MPLSILNSSFLGQIRFRQDDQSPFQHDAGHPLPSHFVVGVGHNSSRSRHFMSIYSSSPAYMGCFRDSCTTSENYPKLFSKHFYPTFPFIATSTVCHKQIKRFLLNPFIGQCNALLQPISQSPNLCIEITFIYACK